MDFKDTLVFLQLRYILLYVCIMSLYMYIYCYLCRSIPYSSHFWRSIANTFLRIIPGAPLQLSFILLCLSGAQVLLFSRACIIGMTDVDASIVSSAKEACPAVSKNEVGRPVAVEEPKAATEGQSCEAEENGVQAKDCTRKDEVGEALGGLDAGNKTSSTDRETHDKESNECGGNHAACDEQTESGRVEREDSVLRQASEVGFFLVYWGSKLCVCCSCVFVLSFRSGVRGLQCDRRVRFCMHMRNNIFADCVCSASYKQGRCQVSHHVTLFQICFSSLHIN